MKSEITVYSIYILASSQNTYYIKPEKFECGSQEAWDEAYKMFELIK